MAIYHLTSKIISRGTGQSAIASAAYRSGDHLKDARSGKDWDYGRKERIADKGIMLPDNAPAAYQDRNTLWEAVENIEKSSKAQLAREYEMALPKLQGFTAEQEQAIHREMVRTFIQENFVKEGRCADYAIHLGEPGTGHPANDHVHIMTTMRPLNEDGSWGDKQHKVYELDEAGNRVPMLNKDGSQKTDKQGRKQWKAHTEKTTDWDSKENLERIREAWADAVNKTLDRYNPGAAHVDHRSYEERDSLKLPTRHEGYKARALQKQYDIAGKGEKVDLIKDNEEIRAYNREVEKLERLQRNYNRSIAARARLWRQNSGRSLDDVPTSSNIVTLDSVRQLPTSELDEPWAAAQERAAGRIDAPADVPLPSPKSNSLPEQQQDGTSRPRVEPVRSTTALRRGSNEQQIASAAKSRDRYAAELDRAYQQTRLRRIATYNSINSPQLREAIQERLQWFRETPRPATKGVGLAMRYLRSVVGKDPAEEYNAKLSAYNARVDAAKAAYRDGLQDQMRSFSREEWEKSLRSTDPLYKTLNNYRIADFKSRANKTADDVSGMIRETMRRSDVISFDRFREVMAGRGLFMDEGSVVRDLFGNRWTDKQLGISADDVDAAIEYNIDSQLTPAQRIARQLQRPHDVYLFDLSTDEGQDAAYSFAKKLKAVPPNKGKKSYTRYLLSKATQRPLQRVTVKGARRMPIYAALAVTKTGKVALSAVGVATEAVAAVGKAAQIIPVVGNVIAGCASVPNSIVKTAKKGVDSLDRQAERISRGEKAPVEAPKTAGERAMDAAQKVKSANSSVQSKLSTIDKLAKDLASKHDKVPAVGFHAPPKDGTDWAALMEAARGQGLMAEIAREKMAEKQFAREYL